MKVGQHLEIPYKNVKHAFFQPAVNARDQCITLIHFNLHDPMMIGKKKTRDVQVRFRALGYRVDARNGYPDLPC